MDPAVFCYIGPPIALIGLLLCFPSQPRSFRLLGAVLAAVGAAIAAYGILRVFGAPIMASAVVPVGVVAAWLAGRMITHRNPVYAALYFGGVVILSAVLVLILGAHFLAAVLIIVYAGAILVAYVFVIMLAQQAEPADYDQNVRQPVAAIVAGLGLIAAVLWALMKSPYAAALSVADAAPFKTASGAAATAATKAAATDNNVVSLGSVLFGDYPVSIEVAGVFLLIAMIGAIVLAGMRVSASQQQA